MRPEEIRELSDIDVAQKLEELSDELFNLRMQGAYEELENPKKVHLLRRDIAKLKTIKRERELEAARAAQES